jgi:hypothetical protein
MGNMSIFTDSLLASNQQLDIINHKMLSYRHSADAEWTNEANSLRASEETGDISFFTE